MGSRDHAETRRRPPRRRPAIARLSSSDPSSTMMHSQLRDGLARDAAETGGQRGGGVEDRQQDRDLGKGDGVAILPFRPCSTAVPSPLAAKRQEAPPSPRGLFEEDRARPGGAAVFLDGADVEVLAGPQRFDGALERRPRAAPPRRARRRSAPLRISSTRSRAARRPRRGRRARRRRVPPSGTEIAAAHAVAAEGHAQQDARAVGGVDAALAQRREHALAGQLFAQDRREPAATARPAARVPGGRRGCRRCRRSRAR